MRGELKLGGMLMNKWCRDRGEFNINALLQFEADHAVKFPDEYVQLVSEHNGARPERNSFDLGNTKEMVFNSLLNWDACRENNISSVYAWFSSELGRLDIVPIANDPFGNYICLLFKGNGSHVVVVWFHETGEIKSSDMSFSNFINSLY
jgi:hypothetical protein